MSNEKVYPYEASEERWYKWRKSLEEDPIIGLCLWEYNFGNFKIECWNSMTGVRIFQFWPGGNGFSEYQELSKVQENADELMNQLKDVRDGLDSGLEFNNESLIFTRIDKLIKKIE